MLKGKNKELELELEIFIFHRKWLKIYIIEKLLSHESDFCRKVMYYSIGKFPSS